MVDENVSNKPVDNIDNQPIETTASNQPVDQSDQPPVQQPIKVSQPDQPMKAVAPARPRKRRNRWLKRLVMLIIWLFVVCVMIVAALMISAWITGFRLENGWPDVFGMIDWVRANYDLPF